MLLGAAIPTPAVVAEVSSTDGRWFLLLVESLVGGDWVSAETHMRVGML